MISAGNDIVALKYTNPERTKQERFYSKIIGRQEVELYKSLDSTNILFENFVWLAWSVKESVYKFFKRNKPEILFSPTKIIIQKIHVPINNFLLNDLEHEAVSFTDECCFCCEVIFNDAIFYTRTLLHDNLIFSVASNTNDFENICWGVKKIDNDIYENQSQEVRDFVLNKMQIIFDDEALSIEKAEAGFPFLAQQKGLPISFAHHGKYVGYSFCLP